VAGGDRRLQSVRSEATPDSGGPADRGQTATDRRPVPEAPFLILQEHRLAIGPGTCGKARARELEQASSPYTSGSSGSSGDNAASIRASRIAS
jgi:hypothetical protein